MSKIESLIKSLIEKLGVSDAKIEVTDAAGVWKVSIDTSDEVSLVGRDNERYEALSHLLKRMIAKEFGEDTKVVIDINGIRAKNDEALKAKAMIIAERARSFKRDVEMDPMTSYERMIVHSALEGQPDIKTESIGEGRDRRLVVRYIESPEG